MPYARSSELSKRLRDILPLPAQRIYRKAYNAAEKYYEKELKQSAKAKEKTAHRVAWAAVKKKYHKVKGFWKRLT